MNFRAKIRWTFAPDFLSDFSENDFENARFEKLISDGRERVELVKIVRGNTSLECVRKTFPRANFLQRTFSEKRVGTKARRAFRAAEILREHHVGTPEPVALGEKTDARGNVLESRLFTKFVPAMTNFRDEMHRLYVHGNAGEISALMQTVAAACRKFHDCGIIHRDLGNQNIGLTKNSAGTWDVIFLDLDRVRIFPAGTLTDEQRGKDLARLWMPSELRWFFSHMYWGFFPVPEKFDKTLRFEVKKFAWDNRTRIFRHPIWGIKRKWDEIRNPAQENPKDGIGLWIWDTKTEQPVIVHDKKHSRAYRPRSNITQILKSILLHGNAVWKHYKKFSAVSFAVPADFSGTLGVCLEADPASWETQLRLLAELEGGNVKLPVLMRAYHHKGREHWRFLCEKARGLHVRGNGVAVALVQDRAAVRVPESWREMVDFVIAGTHDFAEFYEVGHAVNRGKWGVWDFRDYTEKLLPAVIDTKRAFPQIKLTGPACIDFDLHTLPGILNGVPAGTFDALSQHLYVDRRGAPENFQGRFDAVEKCAVHRAFAKTFGFKNEKIIVSEFNWPLSGKGTWSPCAAFFCDETGGFSSPPHVTEEEAAQFAVRYWLLAVASGHVSRLYWWRLAHRCYGLADDSVPENPCPRPAFFALQKMLAALAGTRFERRVTDGVPAGTFVLEFSRGDNSRFRVSWDKTSFPQISQTLSLTKVNL